MRAEPLAAASRTGALTLEPLRIEHAAPMVPVLSDPSLYLFTGGEPPGIHELTARYHRQLAGHSPDGSETWLNWIVTDASGTALGFVQATLRNDVAELAWVISPEHQGRGIATAAARAVREWLRLGGQNAFVAHIRPGHHASETVARRLGLAPTGSVVDGEVRWES